MFLFQNFVSALREKQQDIIEQLEAMDGSGQKFTNDTWGVFDGEEIASGGLTRVLQGGDVIEKGACSFTLIQRGILSSEHAKSIRSRQHASIGIKGGDRYSAAALSIVLHSRSPMVPTFRSDVRIFSVETRNGKSMAWFGGGADLSPYYLFEDDVRHFHHLCRDLCDEYLSEISGFSYQSIKKECDAYFYLPARSEHRGTGGIFFDDMEATESSSKFVQAVADTWLPSWLPIVERHRNEKYTDKQRHWQLLRRGRYLEFNLLYDRYEDNKPNEKRSCTRRAPQFTCLVPSLHV
jgi:coproporphyrinogen III oxidase